MQVHERLIEYSAKVASERAGFFRRPASRYIDRPRGLPRVPAGVARVLVTLSLAILAGGACIPRERRTNAVPQVVTIREEPSPPPDFSQGKDESKFLYFEGRENAGVSEAAAIKAAFADAIDLLIAYIGIRVESQYIRSHVDEQIKGFATIAGESEEKIKEFNSIVARIKMTGAAIVRRAKIDMLYVRTYYRASDPGRLLYDAHVRITYPREEYRQLRLFQQIVGTTTPPLAQIDNGLPNIKMIDLSGGAHRLAGAIPSILWLLSPRLNPVIDYAQDRSTFAFISPVSLQSLGDALEQMEKAGILADYSFRSTGMNSVSLDAVPSTSGLSFLGELTQVQQSSELPLTEKLIILARLSSQLSDENPLQSKIAVKRDSIAYGLLREHPLSLPRLYEPLLAYRREWMLELFSQEEMGSLVARDSLDIVLSYLASSLEGYWKSVIMEHPERIEVIEGLLLAALDMCMKSGLYETETFHELYAFLQECSFSSLTSWEKKWGFDKLDDLRKAYEEYRFDVILQAAQRSARLAIEDYYPFVSELVLRSRFWTGLKIDREAQRLLAMSGEVPSPNIAKRMRVGVELFLRLQQVERLYRSGGIEAREASLTGERSADGLEALALSARLLGRGREKGCRVVEELEQAIQLMYTNPLMPNPELTWTLYNLLRWVSTSGCPQSLQIQMAHWIKERLPASARLRELTSTALDSLMADLEGEGEYVYIDSPIWSHSSSDMALITVRGLLSYGGGELKLFNESRNYQLPIAVGRSGHIATKISVPLTQGWNWLTIRRAGKVLGFGAIYRTYVH